MNGMPDVDAVFATALHVGIRLGREEAELFHAQVIERLAGVEAFVQARLPEARPEVTFAKRAPGYRPSAAEDPHAAWMWKCAIAGAAAGRLAGKTVGFMDHIAVAGIPLTFGAHLLEGFVPDVDATVVTRVLAEGATVVGKHAMDGPTSRWGFGHGGDYARPLNPHRHDHCTGGAASGSAAAVAAGEVDIAFGGGPDGSVQVPAAYCGVYGLKPTFGLVSNFGIGSGADPSVDAAGPIARDIEDIARAMEAVAGYDGLDPRQDRAVPDLLDHTTGLRDGVRGLSLGVVEEGFAEADPDVHDSVVAAIDVLESAGARIRRVSIPAHLEAAGAAHALAVEGTRALWDVGLFGAFAKTHYPTSIVEATHRLLRDHVDRLRPEHKFQIILAELSRRRFHDAVYAKAQNVRPTYAAGIDAALGEFDALVMPTCLDLAPRYDVADDPLGRALANADRGPAAAVNGRPYDYTGHPALTVPCGKQRGLPVGLQLVGKRFDDPLLCRIAYGFQHSVDFDALLSTR